MTAVLISGFVASALGLRPLWVKLVGAPSSAKTQALEPTRELSGLVFFIDSLTENAFVSGYVTGKKGNDEEDQTAHDLLAKLEDKVLVIKDMTTLLSLKDEVVKKLLGDLTSIYDGEFSKFTGTRGEVRYDTHFPMIAAVTPQALARHVRYMSMLGARFLDYRIPALTEAQTARGMDLAWEAGGRRKAQRHLGAKMRELVTKIRTGTMPTVEFDDETRVTIQRLGELLAAGRASFSYVKDGSNWVPESMQREEPWRAIQQLRLLVACLVMVHGRDRVTGHELEMARRVVLSTIPETRARVLAVFQRPDKLVDVPTSQPGRDRSQSDGTHRPLSRGVTYQAVIAATGLSLSRVREVVAELVAAGVLVRIDTPEGTSHVFNLVPAFDDLLRKPVEQLDHVKDLGV